MAIIHSPPISQARPACWTALRAGLALAVLGTALELESAEKSDAPTQPVAKKSAPADENGFSSKRVRPPTEKTPLEKLPTPKPQANTSSNKQKVPSGKRQEGQWQTTRKAQLDGASDDPFADPPVEGTFPKSDATGADEFGPLAFPADRNRKAEEPQPDENRPAGGRAGNTANSPDGFVPVSRPPMETGRPFTRPDRVDVPNDPVARPAQGLSLPLDDKPTTSGPPQSRGPQREMFQRNRRDGTQPPVFQKRGNDPLGNEAAPTSRPDPFPRSDSLDRTDGVLQPLEPNDRTTFGTGSEPFNRTPRQTPQPNSRPSKEPSSGSQPENARTRPSRDGAGRPEPFTRDRPAAGPDRQPLVPDSEDPFGDSRPSSDSPTPPVREPADRKPTRSGTPDSGRSGFGNESPDDMFTGPPRERRTRDDFRGAPSEPEPFERNPGASAPDDMPDFGDLPPVTKPRPPVVNPPVRPGPKANDGDDTPPVAPEDTRFFERDLPRRRGDMPLENSDTPDEDRATGRDRPPANDDWDADRGSLFSPDSRYEYEFEDPVLPGQLDRGRRQNGVLRRRGASRAISNNEGASVLPEWFSKTRDKTLGLTTEDRDPYFEILALAASLPPKTVGRYAQEVRQWRRDNDRSLAPVADKPRVFPAFVDLFSHPNEYRGKPVTLHGYLRKLVSYDPGENPLGLKTVYEGWIYTDDSQKNPAVVIFTRKPEGLPIGGNLTAEVKVTGYFFKMYGYEAQDTHRFAPLILASTVEWFPPPVPTAFTMPAWAYGVLGLGALWVVIGLWGRDVNRRYSGTTRTLGRYIPPVLESTLDVGPPVEFLPQTDAYRSPTWADRSHLPVSLTTTTADGEVRPEYLVSEFGSDESRREGVPHAAGAVVLETADVRYRAKDRNDAAFRPGETRRKQLAEDYPEDPLLKNPEAWE